VGEYDISAKDVLAQNKDEFVSKTLGINPSEIKGVTVITPEFQETREIRADEVLLVELNDGKKMIIHIEFQSSNDKTMEGRMLEYYGKIYRHYPDTDIIQTVLYTGSDECTMKNGIKKENHLKLPSGKLITSSINFNYAIIDVGDKTIEEIMEEQNPVEMSFLPAADRDLRKKNPDLFLDKVTDAIKEIAESNHQHKNLIVAVNLIYSKLIFEDIEKIAELLRKKGVFNLVDLRTVPGIKDYIEEAEKRGLQQGEEKGIEKVAARMLRKGMPIEEVQEYTLLTAEKLRELAEKIKQETVNDTISKTLSKAKTTKRGAKLN